MYSQIELEVIVVVVVGRYYLSAFPTIIVKTVMAQVLRTIGEEISGVRFCRYATFRFGNFTRQTNCGFIVKCRPIMLYARNSYATFTSYSDHVAVNNRY